MGVGDKNSILIQMSFQMSCQLSVISFQFSVFRGRLVCLPAEPPPRLFGGGRLETGNWKLETEN
jgi:hypothetical protein